MTFVLCDCATSGKLNFSRVRVIYQEYTNFKLCCVQKHSVSVFSMDSVHQEELKENQEAAETLTV